MEKFTEITSVAAPLPLINIDTDMIIPKQFLKTIKRTGLGENLFDEMRYDTDGNEIADFVLNKSTYRNAQIIVAGDNFGCGSSREHAPWALLDFGIRSIIAPSFADIFYNNCFKNGILPVKLTQEQVDILLEAANSGQEITVNLSEQNVSVGNHVFSFELDGERKHRIANGLDDISLTLEKEDKITAFEATDKMLKPWLYTS